CSRSASSKVATSIRQLAPSSPGACDPRRTQGHHILASQEENPPPVFARSNEKNEKTARSARSTEKPPCAAGLREPGDGPQCQFAGSAAPSGTQPGRSLTTPARPLRGMSGHRSAKRARKELVSQLSVGGRELVPTWPDAHGDVMLPARGELVGNAC